MTAESDLPREPPGVFYPVRDDAGRSALQSVVIHLLLDLLEDDFAVCERQVFVGATSSSITSRATPAIGGRAGRLRDA